MILWWTEGDYVYFLKPKSAGVSFYMQKGPEYSARAAIKLKDWSRDPDTGSFGAPRLIEKQLISPETFPEVSGDAAQTNCKSAISPILYGAYGLLAEAIWAGVSVVFPKIRQSRDGLHIF